MQRRVRLVAAALTLVMALVAVLALTMWSDGMSPDDASQTARDPGAAAAAIPIAVMGDSNSHSYQDYTWFKAQSMERGGPLRPQTFQWTEVLARLRGHEVDLGPWVRWGRPGVVARAREWLGLRGGRAPPKEDYLYNFANSGASCKNILGGRFRQAPRLVQLMDESPEQWKRGVVVIRIGQNDWGGLVDFQARDPAAPELRAAADHCAGEIGAAIALIHRSHPSTRILVVGVLNQANDPADFDKWQSAAATANFKTAIDGFNANLRRLAAADPRVAYFDDMGWFERHWGSRGPDGKPAYKTVAIGPTLRVSNDKAGDDPHNAVLADHHAGLAWNALWAQAVVARLREAFGLPLTPIGDEEIARFVEPLASVARAPGS